MNKDDEKRLGEPEKYSWTIETMQIINRLTPEIKQKAFEPDWFLLRQRFEEFESRLRSLTTLPNDAEKVGVLQALQVASIALDDWLNDYGWDFCDELRVKEARQRIREKGTIGYITEVQTQIRSAITQLQKEGK